MSVINRALRELDTRHDAGDDEAAARRREATLRAYARRRLGDERVRAQRRERASTRGAVVLAAIVIVGVTALQFWPGLDGEHDAPADAAREAGGPSLPVVEPVARSGERPAAPPGSGDELRAARLAVAGPPVASGGPSALDGGPARGSAARASPAAAAPPAKVVPEATVASSVAAAAAVAPIAPKAPATPAAPAGPPGGTAVSATPGGAPAAGPKAPVAQGLPAAGPAVAVAAAAVTTPGAAPARSAPSSAVAGPASTAGPTGAPTAGAAAASTASPTSTASTTASTTASPTGASTASPTTGTISVTASATTTTATPPASASRPASVDAELAVRPAAPDIDALQARAGAAIAAGRADEALASLRAVLQVDPQAHVARQALLALLGRAPRDEAFLAALDEAAGVAPERFALNAARGHADAGRPDAATRILQRVPERARGADWYATAGVLAQRAGRHAEAIGLLRAAVAAPGADPGRAGALRLALADSLQARGESERARSELELAVGSPDVPAELRELARERLRGLATP